MPRTARTWPHDGYMDHMGSDPKAGRLLVATPLLEDPNFRRAVVLIVEHEDVQGTLGVVLNRPTAVGVGQVLEQWTELATEPSVVFRGGPVAPNSALALAMVPGKDEPLGWRALDGAPALARLGLLDLDTPPRLLAPAITSRCASTRATRAGRPGQLEAEIDEGAWYVLAGPAGRRLRRRPRPPVAPGPAAARTATWPSSPPIPDDPAQNYGSRRPRTARQRLACGLVTRRQAAAGGGKLETVSTEVMPDSDLKVHEDREVDTSHGDHERFAHYVDKNDMMKRGCLRHAHQGAVRQGLGAEPGPEEVPGVPGVQGNLRVAAAGDGDDDAAGSAAVPESAASVRNHDPFLFSAAGRRLLTQSTFGCRGVTSCWSRRRARARRPTRSRSPSELLARREIAALTIVTPTEHLKYQWAQAAQRFGIAIDPSYRNAQGRAGRRLPRGRGHLRPGRGPPGAAQGSARRTARTLVIFDEIHHAGDALSWGDAVKEAFDPARRRLALTGTPFRSDANPIPFVTYVAGGGRVKRSASDYVYGYGPALADGVVRPVIFLAYSGEMHWRTRAGDEITATLGTPMTKDQIAQAWRTALDPAGEWISGCSRPPTSG